MATVHRLKF